MAEKKQNQEPSESESDLRGTLVRRLAVAGGLVAVLLGVLAFFDYLSSSTEEAETPVFTKPVPVPPKKEVTQPVKPAEPAPEAPKEEAPSQEKKAVETPTAAPEPPPRPEVAAKPAAPVIQPEAKPVFRPPAPPANPVVRQAAVPPPPPPPPPTLAPKPPEEPRTVTPAPRPAEAAGTLRPSPPAPPRLFSGFMLQAGVFTSVQRAEELHAKLTLNGIPSTLEARVQVGPFKDKEEAAVAQEKLQALGIRAVLVSPRGAR